MVILELCVATSWASVGIDGNTLLLPVICMIVVVVLNGWLLVCTRRSKLLALIEPSLITSVVARLICCILRDRTFTSVDTLLQWLLVVLQLFCSSVLYVCLKIVEEVIVGHISIGCLHSS